ncbi:molybdopterin molybdotransferase MoeA [Erythrobacter sp. F6033]|uniref:molybdopterin molybdotransferase MoeA n=1 Tax=Erythrobacter sp. F6033 TaxID=2926401 RepID=UPI001FF6C7E3|nr:molybdopterin molybdotransferase MoeA [Erythrobacter sp. F6033]MCK0128306.1 molybdopterin molybdotransferase MoeA [Erythrobacter sp. F6033]
MLTLEEAQAKLLALASDIPPVEIQTHLAQGHHVSEDVTAVRTQPAADLSAMDGYAICGNGPWDLVGESRAGAPLKGHLIDGQCARISTGAHLPDGSDRILIQENAVVDGQTVSLRKGEVVPESAQHIRRAGFDFHEGDTLLHRGTLIGPAQIALALSGGLSSLPVLPAPRIAVLDSGDELVRLPATLAAHQIPASNGAMLRAMISPIAGTIDLLGPVADNLDALADALSKTNDCDVLVTSGGASVGDHDLIQQALINWGAEIEFWKVAIKPGKPLMIATRQSEQRKQVILGLPGNPVSSFVTCYLFALPLIRAMMGFQTPFPGLTQIPTKQDLPPGGHRREFLRAVSDGQSVWLTDSQDSSALQSLAKANCLIDRPSGCAASQAGAEVGVFWLENGGKPRS